MKKTTFPVLMFAILCSMIASCVSAQESLGTRVHYDLGCRRERPRYVELGGDAWRVTCEGRSATYICLVNPEASAFSPMTCRREPGAS